MNPDKLDELLHAHFRIRAEDPAEREEVFCFLEDLGYSSKLIRSAMGGRTFPEFHYVGVRSNNDIWIYVETYSDERTLRFSEIAEPEDTGGIPSGADFQAALNALFS